LGVTTWPLINSRRRATGGVADDSKGVFMARGNLVLGEDRVRS